MVLLRVIATCLISLLLSLAAPPSAPAALSPAAQSPAYAYDNAHIPSVTADAPAERGPPATYDQHTAYNAVDRWSYGASARREQPTRPGFYDYDGIAPVVQIASVAITTQEATRGSTGPLASFQRSEVAAKAPATVNVTERLAPHPVKPAEALDRWNEFLGPGPHTNLHPRTGLPDPNRIVSADGLRSIRFGPQEMNSSPTKFHYHEETWTFDAGSNAWQVDNLLVRVPFPKGAW